MCFAMTLPAESWAEEVARLRREIGERQMRLEALVLGDPRVGVSMQRMVSPPRSIEIVEEIGGATIQSPPLPPPETNDEQV